LPDHQLPSSPQSPFEPGRTPQGQGGLSDPDDYEYEPRGVLRPPRRDRPWINALLLVLTFLTTTWMGSLHYHGFLLDFVPRPLVFTTFQDLLIGGLWYSVPLMAFFGAHEMGHYLACRYYRVDATLPFFLPFLGLTGTLGAFIRIRSPIRTKTILFDIGVAGPIAGFVVVVPLMVVGLSMSRVVPLPADFVGLELGEPLIFQWVARLIWGPIPEGHSLNLHPMAFAAWFGLLATALNLFPIGQLDGGHISYSVFGRKSTYVTLGAVGTAVLLTFVSLSWIIWAALMVIMLIAFGPRHPSTLDEHVPLDQRRLAIAGIALLIFVACFTPAPIQPYELIRGR
jgi:membrane-associated protease RseP (regulator of RpoE activity)